MWEYDYSTLCHHGILGQKWGVRRFQNPDGTLTEAGKKRKTKESIKEIRKTNKNRFSLSNEDLKKNMERLELQKRMKELTNSEINEGREYVKNILKDIGKKTITTAGTGLILYGMKSLLDKAGRKLYKSNLKRNFISESSTKKQNINDMDDLIYVNKRKKEYNF